MWKFFRERNTKKGLKNLERKINEFYEKFAYKECCYRMNFIPIRHYIVAILDCEVCDNEEEIRKK